jgi:alcohol dehydrogenase class IV
MSKAAYLAGAAINITKTTAAHALSYPLTSRFAIPHGQAVCLTLGPLLVYNGGVTEADAVDPRGAGHVRRAVSELVALLGCESAVEGRDRIRGFIQSIGLKTRFAEFGLSCADAVEWVVRNANVERLTNNPRGLDEHSVRRLLAEVC